MRSREIKLKVAVVCNCELTDKGLSCASWIQAIIEKTSKDFEYFVLSSLIEDNTKGIFFSKSLKLIKMPKNSTDIAALFKELNFDAIILFGTESGIARRVLEAFKGKKEIDKTIVFSQGFCQVCAKHYVEGLPKYVVNRITFRDFIKRDSIKKQIRVFKRKTEDENYALRHCRHFIGRTTMDKALLCQSGSGAQYYLCKDVLREVFYVDEWKYDKCKKHSVFVSQYYYPLKGFHYLLEAISILKNKYPDITVVAAGYNPIFCSKTKYEIKDSSYILYIKELIKRYKLENNIEFIGVADQNEMKKAYLNSNVFVMPSTIENSPNSLAEAMMLGVPTIASDVGGVSDYAVHGEEAYIYPSSATYLLAFYIDEVFEKEYEAEEIGKKGRLRAMKEYDQNTNICNFEGVIKRIAESTGEL